jgi:hypothetical protein
VVKDEPSAYEEVAGLAFYAGQKIYLPPRNPPKPPLPWTPEERFVLSEAEFDQLWGVEERVYLVTDAYDDGQGILARQTATMVAGKVEARYMLSNKASAASSRHDTGSKRLSSAGVVPWCLLMAW